MAAALADVCDQADLDPAGAELLRFTNNAVYSLVSAPVVVRIVGSETLRHRVAKVVTVAEHFARHDVPAVRLFPGIEQPVSAGEHVATLWWRASERPVRSSPADLARLLRQVHALPVPEGVPGWSPLTDVRSRVADAEELDLAARRFLLDRCDEVQANLDVLDFPLSPALVHGDAHLGNVLAGEDGPLLCDFDSSGVGPPEWDLMPVALGVLRFGEPMAVYEELADAYGFDVMAWDGFEVLRAARELKLTTSVLPILRSHPDVRPEFERRLTDLRAGNREARWTRYR
ncbi:aminoglycoside phosphotransferase family protein [Haloechinothrix salitolerans]|uniref:Phosphotransferase family protein n=1 Tax=Haloechinothrix salitolerans TaxID=926830 RepID=A0ABW2BTV2_9PSEU